MVVSALVVMVSIILTVPLAYASPPDPTWIPGLYDDADYDDVVGLATDGTGASNRQAPPRVEQGPVASALLREPGPTPDSSLRTDMTRGPPVEARDATVSLEPKPSALPIFLIHLKTDDVPSQLSIAGVTTHTVQGRSLLT